MCSDEVATGVLGRVAAPRTDVHARISIACESHRSLSGALHAP